MHQLFDEHYWDYPPVEVVYVELVLNRIVHLLKLYLSWRCRVDSGGSQGQRLTLRASMSDLLHKTVWLSPVCTHMLWCRFTISGKLPGIKCSAAWLTAGQISGDVCVIKCSLRGPTSHSVTSARSHTVGPHCHRSAPLFICADSLEGEEMKVFDSRKFKSCLPLTHAILLLNLMRLILSSWLLTWVL